MNSTGIFVGILFGHINKYIFKYYMLFRNKQVSLNWQLNEFASYKLSDANNGKT